MRNPGKTMTSHAESLGLSTAAITGLADTLEKRGYMKRIPDENGDRRKKILVLTEEGQNILTEYAS
jgi:DNA-binding MarR family transcriptional regulator